MTGLCYSHCHCEVIVVNRLSEWLHQSTHVLKAGHRLRVASSKGKRDGEIRVPVQYTAGTRREESVESFDPLSRVRVSPAVVFFSENRN